MTMPEPEEAFDEAELAERIEEPAPIGFDRSNAQTAQQVIEKLLPQEEERLEVLSFFALAILKCQEQGESKWGVTLYPNSVALNISGFYACWVRSTDVFVSIMENALAPEVWTAMEDKVKLGGAFKRLPDSRYVYVSYVRPGEVLPELIGPIEEFIAFTGSRYARMGARVEGAHSPGVLEYLREYLEMDLPEPVYPPKEEETEEDDAIVLSTDAPNFWKIAPGGNGFLWDECRERSCILIGWSGIRDILSFPDKAALAQANVALNHKKSSTSIQWRFAHDIRIGDIVVANRGNNQVVGIGVITSDYLPSTSPNNPSSNEDYPHARLVDWRITQTATLPRAFFGQIPLAVQWIYPSRWKAIRDAYLAQHPGDAALKNALDTLETYIPALILPSAPISVPKAVAPLLQMAERTRNILLYGPPGTGKTWLVTQFAKAFTEPDKVAMVTFHQSFAYEEFVEGVKPVIVEGKIDYGVRDGVFKRICKSAQADPDGRYLLIIDEINRANIAKVLGELITLIEDDKRLGEANEVQVTLPYSGERFGVPANLTILGTMNTADRSIALLDLALRRRFTFVEMPPYPTLLSEDVAGVNVQMLLTRLNKRVGALLDPDHRIGHSYLMGLQDADDLHFAWYRRIVPLLQEYFYHDGERLQAVLGKAFVVETALDEETKTALGGAYEDVARYEVKELAGAEFLATLRGIAGQ